MGPIETWLNPDQLEQFPRCLILCLFLMLWLHPSHSNPPVIPHFPSKVKDMTWIEKDGWKQTQNTNFIHN